MQRVALSQNPPVFARLALHQRRELDAAMVIASADEITPPCRTLARLTKLSTGSREISLALTAEHYATASTQHQALSAILRLYREVLKIG